MRVLLDHCVNWRLARFIVGHEVFTARRMGWDRVQNGALVGQAEQGGFDALITVDKNMRHQQNLAGRRLAIVVLQPRIVDLPSLVPLAPALLRALDTLTPGAFVVIRPEPSA